MNTQSNTMSDFVYTLKVVGTLFQLWEGRFILRVIKTISGIFYFFLFLQKNNLLSVDRFVSGMFK